MKTPCSLTDCAAVIVVVSLTWAVLSQTAKTGGAAPVRIAAHKTAAQRALPPVQIQTRAASAVEVKDSSPGLTEEEAAALANLEALLTQEDGSANAALEPLRAWAEKNPSAAARWVAENLFGAARRRALVEVIALWAASSPQAALAWLDAQPTYEGNEEAYSAAFATLAAADSPAAAAWLQQHPDLVSRENWEILFSHWTAADTPAATAWLRNFSSDMQEALLPTVLAGMNSASAAIGLVHEVQPQNADAVLASAIGAVSQAAPQYALDLAAWVADDTARATLTESIQHDFDPSARGSTEIPLPSSIQAAAPVAVE